MTAKNFLRVGFSRAGTGKVFLRESLLRSSFAKFTRFEGIAGNWAIIDHAVPASGISRSLPKPLKNIELSTFQKFAAKLQRTSVDSKPEENLEMSVP